MHKLFLMMVFVTQAWAASAQSWWEKLWLVSYQSIYSELEGEIGVAEGALLLDGVGLTAEDALDIAKGLKANKKLTSLDLESNRLGTEGVKIILEALKENKTLREIDLSNNGCHLEKLKGPIGQLLDVNRTLQVLTIDLDGSLVQKEVNILLANPRRGGR